LVGREGAGRRATVAAGRGRGPLRRTVARDVSAQQTPAAAAGDSDRLVKFRARQGTQARATTRSRQREVEGPIVNCVSLRERLRSRRLEPLRKRLRARRLEPLRKRLRARRLEPLRERLRARRLEPLRKRLRSRRPGRHAVVNERLRARSRSSQGDTRTGSEAGGQGGGP
jgi:hypothetical protein